MWLNIYMAIYNVIIGCLAVLTSVIMIVLRCLSPMANHLPAVLFFYALYQTFHTGTDPWLGFASIFAVLEIAVLYVAYSKKKHGKQK